MKTVDKACQTCHVVGHLSRHLPMNFNRKFFYRTYRITTKKHMLSHISIKYRHARFSGFWVTKQVWNVRQPTISDLAHVRGSRGKPFSTNERSKAMRFLMRKGFPCVLKSHMWLYLTLLVTWRVSLHKLPSFLHPLICSWIFLNICVHGSHLTNKKQP